ncbi:stalk domain-containing protein [Clostridium aminobutyricum]|uniref:Copper amine oxidase-like N-terminal domain-containing protein n=1 Tax=Clostridium aminobutyricum TaxID=33953 RepID=A0A939DAH8_CLOAM|nr:stalk domain-containing protein [Clostridium aminobutyricum]MBN7774037.1 hypothetical protein [Clostridium aminobutyricum]
MKRTKRIIGIVLSLSLILGTSTAAFAASSVSNAAKPASTKVLAYIKPDLKVRFNDETLTFKDSNNQIIYPLVYRGSAYLPIRAISALIGEDIEWDNYSQTVFIGKTLSNPSKSKIKMGNQNAFQIISASAISSIALPFLETVYVKPDINIMYDFELKSFTDSNNQTVYPIIYNGSTYLPIRCLSSLMNKPITWDNVSKTIIIGNITSGTSTISKKSQAILNLEAKYESAIELYDQATDKIKYIHQSTDSEKLNLIAAAVTEDVALAQKQTIDIKNMNTADFTEDELKAKDVLYAFVESSEYYILVLENISYLAASYSDYSMLAETFMDLALQSRDKMDDARTAIEKLQKNAQ